LDASNYPAGSVLDTNYPAVLMHVEVYGKATKYYPEHKVWAEVLIH